MLLKAESSELLEVMASQASRHHFEGKIKIKHQTITIHLLKGYRHEHPKNCQYDGYHDLKLNRKSQTPSSTKNRASKV